MKPKIIITILLIGFYLNITACGGGSGAPVDRTESLTLNSVNEGGNADFSALLLQPITENASSYTGFVLLHGRGGNPDSAVVRQLRKDLYDRGHTTLSIQEAVPSGFVEGDAITKPSFSAYINDVNGTNSVFLETYARVRTAINELETKGSTRVVIIGFSLGSRISAAYVARGQVDELPIAGLVGIGMYAGVNDPDPLKTTLTLDEVGILNIPVLDIYGDKDTNSATTAVDREAAYNSGFGTNYTQMTLSCDDISSSFTINDCHKLVNLKGSSSSPLEVAVSQWIASL